MEEEWVTEEQISKVDSVLKSLARDWSADGKDERSVAYDRIINAIESYYENNTTKSYNCPDHIHRRANVRIAVPGSGLGRLAWELYSRGYTVEGSDFSLPMLVASDFILNGRCGVRSDGENDVTTTTTQLQFAISPWLAETKNVLSIENRVRSVIVPDIDPGIVLLQSPKEQHDEEEEAEFTMLAGEFLHLYSHFLPDQQQTQPNDNNYKDKHSSPHQQRQNKFHVVACSFFLDTAPTLPHYLQTIYHMLEVGGLLVHFGPLMYHWSGHGNLLPGDEDVVVDTNVGITAGVGEHDYTSSNIQQIKSSYNTRNDRLDSRYLISIDYTWDEVHEMLTNIGFEIIVEERNIPARYTSDACSMMHVVYDCVFCVARRIR